MSVEPHGELVPVGGGDTIPLIRDLLVLGRRESCDVCLRFPNVSGVHCELAFRDGYWVIKDLNSTNGIKVNGVRVPRKLLHPDDTITIAKRHYTIHYNPPVGQRLEEIMEDEDILNQPLLERAGLERPRGGSRWRARRVRQPGLMDTVEDEE
jgi:adenylate cyclase